MANFHITEEGPKPCEATIKACPVGGSHFQDRKEADKAYEDGLAKKHPAVALTKTSSELPTLDVKGLSAGDHTVNGVEVRIGGAENINWRSDCGSCSRQGKGAFAPAHDASRGCQSGGHSHCTCDRCF